MAQPPEDPRSPAGRSFSLQAPTEAALASSGPGCLMVLLAVGDQPPLTALLLSLAMVLGLRLTLLPATAWSGAWAALRREK
ncbi:MULTISPECIES: hypothetical protein [Streptomyces]|uniref:Uncharacterized protein n=1 Tax=Streptomyces tsukubensis (strain DSM 42081 / NBRC 108919 / NRRL 18488 / 9993) TaxID=1114943 RepID=I2MXN1_STRT9|nr:MULTISPECIES: hypothetical protein [Streptomyces]AZK93899.1 hypothetical protein B7R87_08425 [Streptomyces tsukubensis]EIF89528.1 hypothetical protein [Streptomyces tsukubensis NRRL18488]MYS64243.1 hypothetical protein [Streptomyces sp. SID5473]QKM69974.1 hypothetical protein STSU_025390 [Streptomyces tsukubensis NRRL18488]TAI46049.1 hypothetical protein EWI31_02775 [Streptomyces tsukubensis]